MYVVLLFTLIKKYTYLCDACHLVHIIRAFLMALTHIL